MDGACEKGRGGGEDAEGLKIKSRTTKEKLLERFGSASPSALSPSGDAPPKFDGLVPAVGENPKKQTEEEMKTKKVPPKEPLASSTSKLVSSSASASKSPASGCTSSSLEEVVGLRAQLEVMEEKVRVREDLLLQAGVDLSSLREKERRAESFRRKGGRCLKQRLDDEELSRLVEKLSADPRAFGILSEQMHSGLLRQLCARLLTERNAVCDPLATLVASALGDMTGGDSAEEEDLKPRRALPERVAAALSFARGVVQEPAERGVPGGVSASQSVGRVLRGKVGDAQQIPSSVLEKQDRMEGEKLSLGRGEEEETDELSEQNQRGNLSLGLEREAAEVFWVGVLLLQREEMQRKQKESASLRERLQAAEAVIRLTGAGGRNGGWETETAEAAAMSFASQMAVQQAVIERLSRELAIAEQQSQGELGREHCRELKLKEEKGDGAEEEKENGGKIESSGRDMLPAVSSHAQAGGSLAGESVQRGVRQPEQREYEDLLTAWEEVHRGDGGTEEGDKYSYTKCITEMRRLLRRGRWREAPHVPLQVLASQQSAVALLHVLLLHLEREKMMTNRCNRLSWKILAELQIRCLSDVLRDSLEETARLNAGLCAASEAISSFEKELERVRALGRVVQRTEHSPWDHFEGPIGKCRGEEEESLRVSTNAHINRQARRLRTSTLKARSALHKVTRSFALFPASPDFVPGSSSPSRRQREPCSALILRLQKQKKHADAIKAKPRHLAHQTVALHRLEKAARRLCEIDRSKCHRMASPSECPSVGLGEVFHLLACGSGDGEGFFDTPPRTRTTRFDSHTPGARARSCPPSFLFSLPHRQTASAIGAIRTPKRECLFDLTCNRHLTKSPPGWWKREEDSAPEGARQREKGKTNVSGMSKRPAVSPAYPSQSPDRIASHTSPPSPVIPPPVESGTPSSWDSHPFWKHWKDARLAQLQRHQAVQDVNSKGGYGAALAGRAGQETTLNHKPGPSITRKERLKCRQT